MKHRLVKVLFIGTFIFLFSVAVYGQSDSNRTRKGDDNIAFDAMKGLGKTGVIVVGSAAKVTWATTKFTAKHVAKPVAKTIIVKGTPAAAKFALKSSGTAAKHLVPIAAKLVLL